MPFEDSKARITYLLVTGGQTPVKLDLASAVDVWIVKQLRTKPSIAGSLGCVFFSVLIE